MNTNEDELHRFLGDLRFDIARDPEHVVELVQQLMFAAGLRHDEAAVHAGTDWWFVRCGTDTDALTST